MASLTPGAGCETAPLDDGVLRSNLARIIQPVERQVVDADRGNDSVSTAERIAQILV